MSKQRYRGLNTSMYMTLSRLPFITRTLRISKLFICWATVAQTLNPSAPLGTQRQKDLSEFKASMVCRASSREATTTQRNHVWGQGRGVDTQRQLSTVRTLCVPVGRTPTLSCNPTRCPRNPNPHQIPVYDHRQNPGLHPALEEPKPTSGYVSSPSECLSFPAPLV